MELMLCPNFWLAISAWNGTLLNILYLITNFDNIFHEFVINVMNSISKKKNVSAVSILITCNNSCISHWVAILILLEVEIFACSNKTYSIGWFLKVLAMNYNEIPIEVRSVNCGFIVKLDNLNVYYSVMILF